MNWGIAIACMVIGGIIGIIIFVVRWYAFGACATKASEDWKKFNEGVGKDTDEDKNKNK